MSNRCDQLARAAKIMLHGLALGPSELEVDFAGGVTKALHVAAGHSVGLSGGMVAHAVCDGLVRHVRAALSPFEHGKVPMQVAKHRAAGHWIYRA